MPDRITSLSRIDFKPSGKVFPSPADWRDQFIYFLLVDRFDDNDATVPPYDPARVSGSRIDADGARFQGGNLKGVLRRLDYINNLGCTAIWLSPIFKNRVEKDDSYHGYGIQNFLELDPRFGTKTDLLKLVKAAHKRNMFVICDIILNHTGDNWAYPHDAIYKYFLGTKYDFGFWREVNPAQEFQEHDAVWPEEFQDIEGYKRRGKIMNWNDRQEAIDGDFETLKELDITRPTILDALIKSYKYWIATADIDGFRVDTVKHMESSETAIFCNALREYAISIGKKNFFMFGEIVDDDYEIQKYIGRNSRIDGTDERFPSLDSCLDFPLYFVLEEVIKGFADPRALRDRYDRFKHLYTDHGAAARYFVTFVDNHDQMCRPYRRFMHNNTFPQQAVNAIGYLLTSQGIPCIYYGTEQGFDGGGNSDRHVRECMFGGTWGAFDSTGMHFFNEQHEIYSGIRRICDIRKTEPALRYGRQYFREISGDDMRFYFPATGGDILAYSRVLDSTEILIVINSGPARDNVRITVDRNLTRPGDTVTDLLGGLTPVVVSEYEGRAYITVSLSQFQMAVMKK